MSAEYWNTDVCSRYRHLWKNVEYLSELLGKILDASRRCMLTGNSNRSAPHHFLIEVRVPDRLIVSSRLPRLVISVPVVNVPRKSTSHVVLLEMEDVPHAQKDLLVIQVIKLLPAQQQVERGLRPKVCPPP